MTRAWTDLDFIAGPPSLDFANTASWTEDGSMRRERIHSYDDALAWAVRAGLIVAEKGERLRAEAARDPRASEIALGRLRRFRQDLVDVAVPIAAGEEVHPDAADSLARWFRDAQSNAVLVRGDGHFHFAIGKEANSLDLILWLLAQDALSVLTSADLHRLRRCHQEQCWWFFLDTSKSGNRRWCDMSACGNAAKARRYYVRHHQRHAAA